MKGHEYDDGSEAVADGSCGIEGDGAAGGVIELSRFIPGRGWLRLPNSRKGQANVSADTTPTIISPSSPTAIVKRKVTGRRMARYPQGVQPSAGARGADEKPIVCISISNLDAMPEDGLPSNVMARKAKGGR